MTDADEEALIDQGILLPRDFRNRIDRIADVKDYDVEIPEDLADRLKTAGEGLLIDPDVLLAAAAALGVGHVVLQGPPGTGKSSLARALCDAFHTEVIPVTAHEDWSTFEVIGRQELRFNAEGAEELAPINGYFTDAVVRCAGSMRRHFDDSDEPQATWLLIDELNRAHLDRAFGELFTVLGTDEPVSVTLPHQREGNNNLVTPRRFRIIATLNTVDRQFVNSLSQALRRRFTFITVDIPPRKPATETWGQPGATSLANKEFALVSKKSAARVVRRVADEDEVEQKKQELEQLLAVNAMSSLIGLFNLVAQMRYAQVEDHVPYIPVGTAQMIDTVELFLTRIAIEETDLEEMPQMMDWAASVKIAPLLDSDTINNNDLERLASGLTAPFDQSFRSEIMQIASAGMYYVAP